MQSDELKIRCPGYKPITEAPSMGELKQRAESGGVSLSRLVELERLERYSATDSKNNIFLIQNPAVWDEKIVNGQVVKFKPKPELFQVGDSMQSRKKVGAV